MHNPNKIRCLPYCTNFVPGRLGLLQESGSACESQRRTEPRTAKALRDGQAYGAVQVQGATFLIDSTETQMSLRRLRWPDRPCRGPVGSSPECTRCLRRR